MMTHPTLKWILGRNNGIAGLLGQAMEHIQGHVYVEDNNGERLLGNAFSDASDSYPVLIEQNLAGCVKGTPDDARFIAQLLNQFIGQEINKKRLGSELLHQYKEINLIYAFSEKLSLALDLETISVLVLQEASQIIRFGEGAVVCFDEASGALTLKAHTGGDFFYKTDWQYEGSFFREIAVNGNSAIVLATESTFPEEPPQLILYASLRVRDRILGAVILVGSAGQEFIAADLKLLTTLAFQAAACMESVLLHEKATAQALKDQKEQLVFDLAQKHPFFKKVLSIIQVNLDNPDFSVERLSKAMTLSPSQLQRKVFSLVERTPSQIIRGLRFQKAKDLLRHSDLSIAEIAFQCGFNDPSYFTRLFTRETGVTPTFYWKGNPDGG